MICCALHHLKNHLHQAQLVPFLCLLCNKLEGPNKMTREEGEECEPIKILCELDICSKSDQRASLLTRLRLRSYEEAISSQNQVRKLE
jgi:hypothetical protein